MWYEWMCGDNFYPGKLCCSYTLRWQRYGDTIVILE